MKKYFKITSLVLFTALFASCGDESKDILDVDSNKALVSFVNGESNLPAFEDPSLEYTLEVEVGVTNRVNYDRVVTLAINEELTTATPDQYSIDASSLIIPAGQFVSKIKIKANYDVIEAGAVETLVFDLVSVQDQTNIDPLASRTTINLFQACPIVRDEFIGTYDAFQDGDTYTVNVTAGDAANELTLSNVENISPSSRTTIFINDDVANPQVTYPSPAYPDGLTNYLVADISGYGPAYLVGSSGDFDSCAKTITINYNISVSAGSFAATTVVLTKRD